MVGKHIMRRMKWILVLMIGLLLVGCLGNKFMVFDVDYSVNLARPTEEFPDPKTITPAQQAILSEYGKPDYIRIWWDSEGSYRTWMEFQRAIEKKDFVEQKQSWVYLDKKFEIRFPSQTDFQKVPLTDTLSLIARYGDPEQRTVRQDNDLNARVEVWQYYSAGKLFTILDDKIVKEQTFTQMGKKLKP